MTGGGLKPMLTPKPKRTVSRDKRTGKLRGAAISGARQIDLPVPNSPQAGTSLYGPFMPPTIWWYSIPLAHHLCGQVSQEPQFLCR
jgi:hypothetical protein